MLPRFLTLRIPGWTLPRGGVNEPVQYVFRRGVLFGGLQNFPPPLRGWIGFFPGSCLRFRDTEPSPTPFQTTPVKPVEINGCTGVNPVGSARLWVIGCWPLLSWRTFLAKSKSQTSGLGCHKVFLGLLTLKLGLLTLNVTFLLFFLFVFFCEFARFSTLTLLSFFCGSKQLPGMYMAPTNYGVSKIFVDVVLRKLVEK